MEVPGGFRRHLVVHMQLMSQTVCSRSWQLWMSHLFKLCSVTCTVCMLQVWHDNFGTSMVYGRSYGHLTCQAVLAPAGLRLRGQGCRGGTVP